MKHKENPEIGQTDMAHWILTKFQRQLSQERTGSINSSEQWNTMWEKKKKKNLNLYTPHTILKINLNRLKYIDLNVKHKTVKLLGEKSSWPRLVKEFLDITPKRNVFLLKNW